MFRKKKPEAPAPVEAVSVPEPAFDLPPETQALPEEARRVGATALAFLGDAAYELMVRSRVLSKNGGRVQALHEDTVGFVNAAFQAKAAMRLQPEFTEAEAAVFQRGRNATPGHVPRNQSVADYHMATALEAVFGYLYLTGQTDRMRALFARITEEEDANEKTETE